MPRIRYVGAFDQADVVLVGLTVARGEEFDATDEQAAVLLLAPANYELVTTKPRKADPAVEA